MTIEHTFAAGLVLVQAIFLQPGFTADPGDHPQPGQQVSAAGWGNVPGMSATVTLDDDGLIEVAGHLGFQFEDQRYCEMDDLFMVGVALFIDGRMVRSPASSMRTENARYWQHYQDVAFSWSTPLEAGRHSIQVRAWVIPWGGHSCRAYYKAQQYSGATLKVFVP